MGENRPLAPRNNSRAVNADTLTGRAGQDEFRLQRRSNDEGRLFQKRQKFALINDFDPTPQGNGGDGDFIVLPGSADNYRSEFFGPNNFGTAIFYIVLLFG